MKLIIPLILLMLAACGCNSPSPQLATLLRAEELMEDSTETAIALLDRIDSTLIVSNPDDAAIYQLLMARARDKSYISDTNDSLISTAIKRFRSTKSDHRLMRALFQKAQINFNAGDYTAAITASTEANEIAEKLNQPFWAAKCEELNALIHSHTFNAYNAEISSRAAAMNYQKSGHTLHYKYSMTDAAWACAVQGKNKEAISILDSIIELHPTTNTNSLLNYIHTIRFHIFARLNEIDSATYYLNEADKYRQTNSHASGIEWITRSYIYYVNGDYDKYNSAHANAISTVAYSPTQSDIATLYLYDARIASMQHNYSKSAILMDSAIYFINKSLTKAMKESGIRAQRDFFIYKAEVSKKETKLYQIIALLATLTILLIATIAIFITKIQQRNYATLLKGRISDIKQLTEQLNSYSIQKDKLSELIENQSIGLDELNTSITIKDNELKKLQDSYTEVMQTDIALKQLIIKIFNQHLQTLNTLSRLDAVSNEEASLWPMDSLKEVNVSIRNIFTEENFSDIETIVNHFKNDIIIKIRQQCPFLKQDDIAFITFLIAGFSPKAVGILMGYKTKNVYNKRARIKKRIENSNSPDKNQFLSLL